MRIGVDLGGTKIEAVALDVAGKERVCRRVPTPRNAYDATLRAIRDLVIAVESEVGEPCSVGMGTPGAVSPATGLMKNANSTWLNGRALGTDLEALLQRPIRMANDADCFALSEAVDGSAAGERAVFGVILGTGVGGGVVVDGRALIGVNAVAGEWGHNPMPWPAPEEWPGPPCYCARTGCIETLLSGPALARDYRELTGRDALPADIAQAADRGDTEAQVMMSRYEDRLARALASVINILDPDVIVLGGGMSNTASLYHAVPTLWGAYVFSDRVDTQLVPPLHGDSSGVRGAAWLWPDDSGSD